MDKETIILNGIIQQLLKSFTGADYFQTVTSKKLKVNWLFTYCILLYTDRHEYKKN